MAGDHLGADIFVGRQRALADIFGFFVEFDGRFLRLAHGEAKAGEAKISGLTLSRFEQRTRKAMPARPGGDEMRFDRGGEGRGFLARAGADKLDAAGEDAVEARGTTSTPFQ